MYKIIYLYINARTHTHKYVYIHNLEDMYLNSLL